MTGEFRPKEFIARAVQEIKDTVGDGRAVVATSGGVDSMTCAVLAYRALGDRMLAVFIDDGLMRESESEAVLELLRGMGIRTKLIILPVRFFAALQGLTDPEEKREAFRDAFYRTLGGVVEMVGATHLIQGTIAADIVETKGRVKTQHNVLGQIGIDPKKRWGIEVVEPLETLYKPDVRRVARGLGLPVGVTERMPFPGPGLAARIVGEVTPYRVELVRQATVIVEEEIEALRKDADHPFQAFAVLLNDKATGVRDGERVFGHIIVVRIVDSEDAIIADPTPIPVYFRRRLVERILAEVPGVSRVLFDETPKPPATIEFV